MKPEGIKRREGLAALGGTLLLPWGWPAGAAPAAKGEPVRWPQSLRLLDGDVWRAEQFRDRAMVLVFWSLSCPFCLRHNVHVEKLHRAAAGQALTVLGVVRERDDAALRRHMRQHGLSFAVTQDAEPLAAALNPRRSVPVTVTVDRQGRLRELIPGEMFEEDVLGLLKLAG